MIRRVKKIFDISTESKTRPFIPKGSPIFTPEKWNHAPSLNNCFTYALDIPDAGITNPGYLASDENQMEYSIFRNMPALFIAAQLEKDGLIRIREHEASPEKDHIIAFSSGNGDYHFSRFDHDGSWSHKPDQINPVEKRERHDVRNIFYRATLSDDKYPSKPMYFTVPHAGIRYLPR